MKQKFNLFLLLFMTTIGFWIYCNHNNSFWNDFSNSFYFIIATIIIAIMAVKFQEKSESYRTSGLITEIVLLNTFASCTLSCLIFSSFMGAIMRNIVGIYPHSAFYWIPSLIAGVFLVAIFSYIDYMAEGNTG